MKILYDHQIFTLQKYGGISRYFYELVREFDNAQEVQYEIPLLVSNNHYISDKKFVNYMDLLPYIEFRGKQKFFKYLNEPNTILKLKQQNFDVFHPTYYDPYFLKYLGNKPFVLTVHDMIHEKFSEMFSSADKTSEHKRLLVEKASKIIAISQNTKKDLIELFGTDESKIEVIYLGNSMFPKPNIKQGFDKNNFSFGALGCLLSHRILWKNLVNSSDKYMIILEDDVVIDKQTYQYWIDRLSKGQIGNFDVLFLGAYDGKSIPMLTKIKYFSFFNGFVSNVFEDTLYCTYGYVVSRDGARKLLKKTSLNLPVDYWKEFNKDNDLTYLCIYPNVVKPSEMANESSIQEVKILEHEMVFISILKIIKTNITWFLKKIKLLNTKK